MDLNNYQRLALMEQGLLFDNTQRAIIRDRNNVALAQMALNEMKGGIEAGADSLLLLKGDYTIEGSLDDVRHPGKYVGIDQGKDNTLVLKYAPDTHDVTISEMNLRGGITDLNIFHVSALDSIATCSSFDDGTARLKFNGHRRWGIKRLADSLEMTLRVPSQIDFVHPRKTLYGQSNEYHFWSLMAESLNVSTLTGIPDDAQPTKKDIMGLYDQETGTTICSTTLDNTYFLHIAVPESIHKQFRRGTVRNSHYDEESRILHGYKTRSFGQIPELADDLRIMIRDARDVEKSSKPQNQGQTGDSAQQA